MGYFRDILGILEDSCGISMGSLGFCGIFKRFPGYLKDSWGYPGDPMGLLGISKGSFRGYLKDFSTHATTLSKTIPKNPLK